MEVTHSNEHSAGILVNDYDELNALVGTEGWEAFTPGDTFIGTVTVLKDRLDLTVFTVRIDWDDINVPKSLPEGVCYSGMYLRKEKKKIDWSDMLLMNEIIKTVVSGNAYDVLKRVKSNAIDP